MDTSYRTVVTILVATLSLSIRFRRGAGRPVG
jgi:hypothetical protein